MDFAIFLVLGFIVGFLVGLTGMGGGALMSPVLIFLGIQPRIAIGTDILYATVTRFVGSAIHKRKGSVDVPLALWLFAGSLPGTILGGLSMRTISMYSGMEALNHAISTSLGAVLVFVSLIILYRILVSKEKTTGKPPRRIVLMSIGFLVGIIVQFTSVGSGTLIVFFLITFASLSPRTIVGTDLFHGFLLTAVATLIHSALTNIDYFLAAILIIGSLPGTYIGATMNSRIDGKSLKIILAIVVMIAGGALLIGNF
jgi:hypothetical protein